MFWQAVEREVAIELKTFPELERPLCLPEERAQLRFDPLNAPPVTGRLAES